MGAYPRVCRRWLHSPGYAQLCLPGVDVVGFVASPTASAKRAIGTVWGCGARALRARRLSARRGGSGVLPVGQ